MKPTAVLPRRFAGASRAAAYLSVRGGRSFLFRHPVIIMEMQLDHPFLKPYNHKITIIYSAGAVYPNRAALKPDYPIF